MQSANPYQMCNPAIYKIKQLNINLLIWAKSTKRVFNLILVVFALQYWHYEWVQTAIDAHRTGHKTE